MPNMTALVCRSLIASVFLTGAACATPFKAPARKAFAQVPPSSACMNNSHLASHVAYWPGQPDVALSCGHLLSTDTLLTVHRWDRT